jgi:hypothetical protein
VTPAPPLDPNVQQIRQHHRNLRLAYERTAATLTALTYAQHSQAVIDAYIDALVALRESIRVARAAAEELGIPVDGDAPNAIETEGEEIT